MPDDLMLDPSMVPEADSLAVLLEEAHRGELDGIFLPATFVETRHRPFGLRLGSVWRWDYAGRLVDSFLTIAEDQIRSYTVLEGQDDDDPEMRARFNDVAEDLVEAQILYEEWHFLTQHSKIFSKARDAFDAMIRAGSVVVETSQEKYDILVRRTLKLDDDHDVRTRDRLRGTAKWIAVSGPAIWSLVEPISGAIGSAVGGAFLLTDP